MFKKRYLAIAGFAALMVAAAGCGKKNTTEQTPPVQVTPTETPQATPTVTMELVNMQEATEKNVIGEKTATASKVNIVNSTGSEIAAIYIRQTPSDTSEDEEETEDVWGDDLINGMFTLKNGENAVYYYEKTSSSNTTYDIRITYTDEEANECFFRNLPLTTMKQITLRMDGKGEDSIPYATYFTTTGTKEVSTLNEVKQRLGLDTDSNEDVTPTPDPSDSADPTQTPDNSDNTTDPTQAPSSDDDNNNSDNDNNGDSNNGNSGDDTNPTDSTIQTAEGYIGSSLDDLISAIGDSSSSEYDEDPDNGTSGYYYYGNFTVSTTVDADGNETVTGVW